MKKPRSMRLQIKARLSSRIGDFVGKPFATAWMSSVCESGAKSTQWKEITERWGRFCRIEDRMGKVSENIENVVVPSAKLRTHAQIEGSALSKEVMEGHPDPR